MKLSQTAKTALIVFGAVVLLIIGVNFGKNETNSDIAKVSTAKNDDGHYPPIRITPYEGFEFIGFDSKSDHIFVIPIDVKNVGEYDFEIDNDLGRFVLRSYDGDVIECKEYHKSLSIPDTGLSFWDIRCNEEFNDIVGYSEYIAPNDIYDTALVFTTKGDIEPATLEYYNHEDKYGGEIDIYILHTITK